MQLESVCSIPIEEYLLTRIAFTPDGHHILIGHRNPALYDILSGRPVRNCPFEAFLSSIAYSPDGRYVAMVNANDNHPRTPGLARVFDSATGDLLYEAKTAVPVGTGCFFRNEAGTVFLYRDTVEDESGGVVYHRNIVRGCRVPSGERVMELDLPDWEVRTMACHGDRLMLFGLDSVARTRRIEGASLDYRAFKAGAFSLPDGQAERLCEFGIGLGSAAFSPRGRLLAAEVVNFRENERHLAVLDSASCSVRPLLGIQADVVPSLAFSEDDRYLAYLSEDASGSGNTLRIWEAGTLSLAGETPFGPQYHAVAVHAGTSRLAALGGGRCDIGLFELEPA